MREYITEHTVANAIRMKRSLFVGSFLIVEGVSDKRVYGLVVDQEACSVEISHGRENALGAIRILNRNGFAGVAAIIDADAAKLRGEDIRETNVFCTDLHDLECMMLNSPAFDRVLDEFGSEARILAFAQTSALISRQLAINATPLGCIRLLSLRQDLQLKFEGLTFSRFVRENDLKIDVAVMIREVLNNSQKHHLDRIELARQVSTELGKGHDCWHVSCGHDIVAILSLAFRKTLGAKKAGEVAPDVLERCLRLAYDAAYLRETKFYQAIVDWEEANASFAILNRA
jgi:hypothetical protein